MRGSFAWVSRLSQAPNSGEGGPSLVSELGAAHQRVAEAVADVEQVDHLVVADDDLDMRDESRQRILRPAGPRLLEQRLHPVRLGADAVDGRDLGSVRELVDRVADVGVGRREDHAALALHRQEPAAQHQRDGAARILGHGCDQRIGERFGHRTGSSRTDVMARAWFSWPGQSRHMRKMRVGIPRSAAPSSGRASDGGTERPQAAYR